MTASTRQGIEKNQQNFSKRARSYVSKKIAFTVARELESLYMASAHKLKILMIERHSTLPTTFLVRIDLVQTVFLGEGLDE